MVLAPRGTHSNKPYTASELAEIRQIFRSMPTYNKTTESITYTDVPALFKAIGFERTPAQLKKIQDLWIDNWEGQETEDRFINLFSATHDTSQFARQMVLEMDRNGDGFISESEFKSMIGYLDQHDSGFSLKSFADFVTEADTNKDGKVDVAEATVWLLKQLAA